MSFKKIGFALVTAISLSFAAVSPSFAAEGTSATASASETVLHSGVWGKKSQRSAGTWEIFQADGKNYIRLSSDFKTRGAPDLKIFLSPKTAAESNGRNATQGSVLISPLQSNKGAQTYEIPASIDLASFKSVNIHCEQFSKLWSAADLA